jgi:hypothetical protein
MKLVEHLLPDFKSPSEYPRNGAKFPTRTLLDLPPRTSGKGLRYSVRLDSPHGEFLVRDSLVPFCDAARALLARGVRGEMELWDDERSFPRMRGDIEEYARLTVREDEKTGPQFVVWRPFPAARERPKTADLPSSLTPAPRKKIGRW